MTTKLGELNTNFILINFKDSDAERDFVVLILDVAGWCLVFELDFVFLFVNFWGDLLSLQVFDKLLFDDVWVERCDDIELGRLFNSSVI